MSKPQFAAEPSMEEILSSIRRMISDDKPAHNPIPDQMGRTQFGGGSPAAPAAATVSRGLGSVSPLAPAQAPAPSFSSLSDALKAATTTSEQRRHLQQEIAEVLEKGAPRGGRPELSTFAPATPNAAAARSETGVPGNAPFDRPAAGNGTAHHAAPATAPQSLRTALEGLHSLPSGGRAAEPGADGAAPQRDPHAFDFGTHVPQRDASSNALRADQSGQPIAVAKAAGEASPSPEKQQAEPQAIEQPKSEGQRIVAMPSRAGMIGSGLNGATVAPFPRPMRDVARAAQPAHTDPASASLDEKGDRQPVSAAHEAAAANATVDATTAAPSEEPRVTPEPSPAQSAASEALLDAVVDMVHKQPDSLSVFTSGSAFITGVADKVVGGGKPGAPPKLDRAAAELLRPMLRQWLSDNMPRIVEEALRSELMSTQQAEPETGKGPRKA